MAHMQAQVEIPEHDPTLSEPSRNRRLYALAAFFVVIAAGGLIATQMVGSTSPLDTSYVSHVHVMMVEPDGALLLGVHNSLWTWRPTEHRWQRAGRPLDSLASLCVAALPGHIMLACSADPSTQAVSYPRGMWRSTDGGQTWRRIDLQNRDIEAVATDVSLPRAAVIVAGTDGPRGGVYRSLDGGRSWTRVETSLAGEDIQGVAMVGRHAFRLLVATPDGLWVGTDGGTRWSLQNGIHGQQVEALATSPASAHTLYAGTGGGLWMSRNAGRTWGPLLSCGTVSRVAPTARTGDAYLVCRNRVVHIADGRAVTAASLPAGSPGALAADPTDPRRAYAAYSFPLRVFTTKDGGHTWSQIV